MSFSLSMKIKVLILFILILHSLEIGAFNKKVASFHDMFMVKNISMETGLTHNFVEDIFVDSDGFVWIATTGSLARYDGFEFVNFSTNSRDYHVKSIFVRKMAEDKFKRIWVVSDGGVDLITLNDLKVSDPIDSNGDLLPISHTPSGYVSVDNEGNVWIHSEEFIYCINLNGEGEVAKIDKIPHGLNPNLKTIPVKPLSITENGVIARINNQICNLKFENNKISVQPIINELPFPENSYMADIVYGEDGFWFATDNGLYKCSIKGEKIEEYHPDGETGSLSHNFITSLALLPGEMLIAGTLNGLNVYNRQIGKFENVCSMDINPDLLNINYDFINCLLFDNSNLWVGTEGGGINLFSPRSLMAKLFQHQNSDPFSLSPNPVNAIYEDNDGGIWVGTVEGGLNYASGLNGKFSHFTKESGSLSHNSVSAITSDRKGLLWIGTWGGGVNAVDRDHPGKLIKQITQTDDGEHIFYFIAALCYDPFNDYLWIATNIGLFVYDFTNGNVRVPFPDALKVTNTAGALITSEGLLWLGGESGLFSVNLKRSREEKEFKMVHLPYKLDDKQSGSREKVTCLAITHDGTLWIGSNGNGIYKREVKGDVEEFINYSSKDGLQNNMAHGIAEDPQGNLWIATYHGLSCMTPEGEFINYSKNNGLDTQQFYWNASCRLANGNILFGSIDGLLALKGRIKDSNSSFNPVRFTFFKSDDDEIRGNLISYSLPKEEKSFEVGFSALDYTEGGRFFYRLKGFDDEWKELDSNRHSVFYTNLSHGDYVLEVKYVAAGQSFAMAPVSEFKLKILPHFYKQTWFILLIILLFIGLLFGTYLWRVKDLKKQRNKLQLTVDERVREISIQKQFQEKQTEELRQQNEELIQRNEQISQQKTQLAEMTRRLQKMTLDRISFFTNITHEFRTPITLIIGPIERALKLSTNPKVIEQLNFVSRNSRYLLSLVNQLMDYRKVESGKLDVVTTQGNFRNFIEEILLPFYAYAAERQITIKTFFHLAYQEFAFDHDAIRKVVTNLVGNAIKFTPDKGTISFYAAMKAPAGNEDAKLYLSVCDTGCGIQEDEIGKVFDKFYQGKSQMRYPLMGSSDSGIGLYLCKKIVEIYKGNIKVKNNHGPGCCFRIIVPVPEISLKEVHSTELKDSHEPIESTNYRETFQEVAKTEPLTVLVVEDNSDMRCFMKSILSEQYNVLEASDGKEALSILLSREVDFIISDLMMPGMDGLELAKKVKENFTISHIPFVLLTAKTDMKSRMEGYRNGVDDYISKPFDEKMLLTRIWNILENKRRYQHHFISNMEVEKLNIQTESKDKKFIDKVMEVVKNNYTNSYFEVGDFAEELGVSKSLLNKKLQSLVGQSANQLIRSYRLKVAKELLIQNRLSKDLNISEIAFKVGFNDSKYFTRCFTKAYGMSPSGIQKDKMMEVI